RGRHWPGTGAAALRRAVRAERVRARRAAAVRRGGPGRDVRAFGGAGLWPRRRPADVSVCARAARRPALGRAFTPGTAALLEAGPLGRASAHGRATAHRRTHAALPVRRDSDRRTPRRDRRTGRASGTRWRTCGVDR